MHVCYTRRLYQTDPPTRVALITPSTKPILRISRCAEIRALEGLVGFSVAVLELAGVDMEVGIIGEVTVATVGTTNEVELVVEVVVDTESSD